MRVGKIMQRDLVTVTPETGVLEAIKLMQEFNIRHLPVIQAGQFAGWLSARDLYQVMRPAMLEEITVGEIMNVNPITVSPETGLAEAAYLMREYKIGGVPVLSGRKLVGVLTVIDLLDAFLFMLEALRSSSRLDLALPEDPQALEAACRLIRDVGGEIISIGLSPTQTGDERIYAFRLAKCNLAPILDNLRRHGIRIVELVE